MRPKGFASRKGASGTEGELWGCLCFMGGVMDT
jgi:hypothetical protein